MMSLFSPAEPMPRPRAERQALRTPKAAARLRTIDQPLHLRALLAFATAAVIAAGILGALTR